VGARDADQGRPAARGVDAQLDRPVGRPRHEEAPHPQAQFGRRARVQGFNRSSGGDITPPASGGHLGHAASSATLGDLLLMFARGRRRLRR